MTRVRLAGLLDDLGRGEDADGGRGDDDLEVRVLREQALGLLACSWCVVVAVDGVDELEALVLVARQGRLHQVDPGVLVGRSGGRRQDRDVAGAVRRELARPVREVDADAAEVDLVDEHVVGADRRARVEADDLDARVHRGLQGRGDLILAVGRDDDRADLLGGEVGDERDLEVGLGLVRPDLDDGAAELGGGLVDAGLCGREVLVDDVLRQVADGDRRRPRPAEPSAAVDGAAPPACGRRRRRTASRRCEHAANDDRPRRWPGRPIARWT